MQRTLPQHRMIREYLGSPYYPGIEILHIHYFWRPAQVPHLVTHEIVPLLLQKNIPELPQPGMTAKVSTLTNIQKQQPFHAIPTRSIRSAVTVCHTRQARLCVDLHVDLKYPRLFYGKKRHIPKPALLRRCAWNARNQSMSPLHPPSRGDSHLSRFACRAPSERRRGRRSGRGGPTCPSPW